ncbi:hypothetical protein [Pseudonocardia sp. Ae717_Ps2]|uniref:hypothetical protein n=1 Tax=Pseudonocardia sp. Ae717_Ps2 TaxID=1885573 RepID=UPI001300EB5E|nr:hypothetical protein [Pseudonocardia sp. Ae717_Ps2]
MSFTGEMTGWGVFLMSADSAADSGVVGATGDDSAPVLIFGRGAMTRLVDGRKTATVAGADHELAVGAVGAVVMAMVPGGVARLSLRVRQCHRVPEVSMVPQVAAAAGLELSSFTKCRSWDGYLQGVAQQEFPGPVCVLGVEAVGELVGEVPPKGRPTPKRKRQPPPPPKPKPDPNASKAVKGGWLLVGSSGPVKVTPLTMVHPLDKAVLQQRIGAVMARRAPSLEVRRALGPVVGALLEKGKAGPNGLEKVDRERLKGRLPVAVAWLSQHQLLVRGAWNPKLLVGLRIRHVVTRGGATARTASGTASGTVSGAAGGVRGGGR